jgi:hypothetical protein
MNSKEGRIALEVWSNYRFSPSSCVGRAFENHT